ncbi:MAG: HAMP domain-containing protein [Candidatus Omnitrophota bacterium]|nr:HAMP domain-containing protein [Candidatus Omnitrophota bacterium]
MPNRRRQYFVNKKFQAKFIVKFASLVIIATAVSGAIVYLMARSTVTTSFENSRLVIKSTADFILPSVLLSGAIVIVSLGLATIAVALITSHRIAGPLYRLEKDIKEISNGNLKIRFGLRKGDEMKSLANGLNVMVEALDHDIAGIKKISDDIESALNANNIELAKSKSKDLKKVAEKFKV